MHKLANAVFAVALGALAGIIVVFGVVYLIIVSIEVALLGGQ